MLDCTWKVIQQAHEIVKPDELREVLCSQHNFYNEMLKFLIKLLILFNLYKVSEPLENFCNKIIHAFLFHILNSKLNKDCTHIHELSSVLCNGKLFPTKV